MNKDTAPKHWKLGLFYYNPDNPSEFVDKRKGTGVTINFASTYGRRIFLFILIPAVVMLTLCAMIQFLK
ncbi:DUF5808 domain-containing protein [Clostridium sp. DJ247]|uniref:DUF5808 domain-containing protein n=1 Tax=Clostridium sp. DJ247 TaxID=2726188 RepID=UPI0016264DBC|nr:DUF5808 domain-containing protein [Clostridium sp. DJ247]MBC2579106.1 hypothetical protein [Clostridium sp. DJ247]